MIFFPSQCILENRVTNPSDEYFSGISLTATLYFARLCIVFGPIATIVVEFNDETTCLVLFILNAKSNRTLTACELKNIQ